MSPIQEPGLHFTRRKGRNRSIRNTKDSAEMARLKYQRGQSHASAQMSQTSNGPKVVDRHFSVANVGDNGTVFLSYEAPEGRVGHGQTRPVKPPYPQAQTQTQTQTHAYISPPTPPRTTETDGPSTAAFAWHDVSSQDAADLATFPAAGLDPLGNRASFNSDDIIFGRRSSHFSDISRVKSGEHGPILGRVRSPSFDSVRPPRPPAWDSTQDQERPKTTGGHLRMPFLQVSIPHYRIGSPYFSDRGSPFLHNSFHTAFSSATDLRSSPLPSENNLRLFPVPPRQRVYPGTPLSKSSVAYDSPPTPPPKQFRHTSSNRAAAALTYPAQAHAHPSVGGHAEDITSSLYDTMSTDLDNATYVIYCSEGHEILAATPARLVAEITSAMFLDYDLLSDFFLTYRAFLSPHDLIRYLVARLRWAMKQRDDSGQIVRVRTFVAIRHWILNYFVDDFEPDHDLRMLFCDLVNQVHVELLRRPGGPGSDVKVLDELKKCWKRTCDSIWGAQSGNEAVNAQQAIVPSGRRDDFGNAQRAGQRKSRSYFSYTPPAAARNVIPDSPFSEQSVQVTSCSIPVPKFSRPQLSNQKQSHDKAAQEDGVELVSRTPQRCPSHRRQRSGSFSDALRDGRPPKSSVVNPTSALEPERLDLIAPGGLIRGLSVKPPTSNVVRPGPISPPIDDRQSDVDDPSRPETIANPAVLKLIGGVRRALSYRHASKPSLNTGHSTGDLRMLRDKTSHKASFTSPVRHRKPEETSDALAVMALRSWQHIAQSSRDPARHSHAVQPQRLSPTALVKDKTAIVPPRLNSNVTVSSRSIVIINDTGTTNSQSAHDRSSSFQPGYEYHKHHNHAPEEHLGDVNEAIREMAMNNTAFLLTESLASTPHNAPRGPQDSPVLFDSRTSISTAFTSAPHSPPPAVPLPPLPGQASPGATDRSAATGYHTSSSDSRAPSSRSPVLSDAALHSLGISRHKKEDSLNSLSAIKSRATSPVVSVVGLGSLDLVIHATEESLGSLGPSKSPPMSPKSPVTSHVGPDEPQPMLGRQLRRRPGGNLRAVDTVQALGFPQRRRSTGSFSSHFFSSPCSPVFPSDEYSRPLRSQTTESGLVDTPRRSVRLLSTHSSQPNIRASLKEEMAMFAALPADEDDGGIESTLLKLEGKFSPSRQPTFGTEVYDLNATIPSSTGQTERVHVRIIDDPHHSHQLEHSEQGRTSRRDPDRDVITPFTETQGASIYSLSQASNDGFNHDPPEPSTPVRAAKAPSFASPTFADSPDREVKKSRRSSRVLWPEMTVSPRSKPAQSGHESAVQAQDFAARYTSPKTPRGHARGRSAATVTCSPDSSFLLNDDESLADIASILTADDTLSRQESKEGQKDLDHDNGDDTGVGAEAHTGMEGQTIRLLGQLPTPPATSAASSSRASFKPRPPLLSPGPPSTPKLRTSPAMRERRSADPDQAGSEVLAVNVDRMSKTPAQLFLPPSLPTHHAPFILGYSSSLIAAQLTLVEKDALDCIDWKDLVSLAWSHAPPLVRDWAQYISAASHPIANISSIDLIIARFNLVTKWCISSVLLCPTPAERAACVTKLIHIATHARKKLRNFATAAQLTIGLLGADLARLHKTWALVPTVEKHALKSLEALVSPVRNFGALRAEMESAAAKLDDSAVGDDKGVIPFLGVYTRDLALNDQKPSVRGGGVEECSVCGTPGPPQHGGEAPLVNFEKYRTTAGIVKGVLRLLDASSRYTIMPQPELLSRCLWLAALSDGEIANLSRGLE